MPRQALDLFYEHEMRAVPVPAAVPSQPRPQGGGLVARLRGLKMLMDAERNLAGWRVAAHAVPC